MGHYSVISVEENIRPDFSLEMQLKSRPPNLIYDKFMNFFRWQVEL